MNTDLISLKWLVFVWVCLALFGRQAEGRLLLTELYYNTPGDDALQEWVEIANVGTTDVALAGISLSDETQIGGREGAVQFPADAILAPNEVIVVAQTAVGFHALFGFDPDFEIQDTATAVPDMLLDTARAKGDFALANEGDELFLLTADGRILDAVSYGDSTAVMSPSVSGVSRGQSIARIPAFCDDDTAADWQPQSIPTPGQIHVDGECPEKITPDNLDGLLPIGVVQGRGMISPFVNEIVTIRGVVTGLFEDRNTAGITFYTLFVQDLPGQEDGDLATSDGIAIFLGQQRPSARPGDQVLVTGQVTEFFGFTEIDDNGLHIAVEAVDLPLPEPVIIFPPAIIVAQAAYFEPLEAMRVAFAGETEVVGSTFSGCSFAVVDAAVTKLPILRQNAEDPVGQIVPVLHTSDVGCGDFPHVKAGDRVTGLAGPLIYHFDQFKLVQQETTALSVTAVPYAPLPTPPRLITDQISIALFNMENHFDAVDNTGRVEEPKPTAAEIARKEAKIVKQISDFLGCPTLLGVQEVENEALLLSLAQALAEPCGFAYEVTHFESADTRGIDVALLSDPRLVVIQDAALRQTCARVDTGIVDTSNNCPGGEQPLFSRPPLAVKALVGERPFTLFINHFKSKRGGEMATAPERLAQAQYLNQLVDTILSADPEARVVVMGDFNDYEQSAAVREMTQNGSLTNALSDVPLDQRYTFVFGGAAQLLDGILLSPVLYTHMAQVSIQHINADYPDILAEDEVIPYRATDHDLPVVVINLDNPIPAQTPTRKNNISISPQPAVFGGGSSGDSWGWLVGLGVLVAAGSTAVWVRCRR